MKLTICLLVALCLLVCYAAVPNVSIDDSKVPNVSYELDAVECLVQAYVLFPNDADKRIARFSALYSNKYPKTVWNVATGCVAFFQPNVTYFVSLNVEYGNSTSYVRIFL